MKDWDETTIWAWMRSLVQSWGPETLASWGEPNAAAARAVRDSEAWLDALVASLRVAGAPPGRKLVLLNASKIITFVGNAKIGDEIFAALKHEKEKERRALAISSSATQQKRK